AVGGLETNITVRTGIGLDVDRVLTPLLGEVELLGAVRARIRRSADNAAILDRLVVQIHVLQGLEARGLVHEAAEAGQGRCRKRIRGVVSITGIAGSIRARINTAARRHVGAGRAADGAAGGSAAVDILAVAQLVVVVWRVIALACVE